MTAEPAPVADRHRGSQLTVAGWQTLVLAVIGFVVLAGAVATVVLLNRTDGVARDLVDGIQPSRVAAYQLQAALRDQETAVRGYAIAADRQFLEPYYDGQRAEQVAADDIRARLVERPDLLADLDAIENAAESWRTNYAEPLIRSITPGQPSFVDSATAERGKLEFDNLRALFNVQNEQLSAARATGVDELAQVRTWRDRVLAAIVVAFVAAAVGLAVLVRNAVSRPLARLAETCRRITEGNFTERIVPRGPKDIRGIAVDVENMRQRIVDELDSSRSARERLVLQAEALDEQAVDLRRSNAELEQFAYVASHDLQEPLRKVASFCQLLEKRYGDQLDERGISYIGFAVDGAKRMQVLINDLLTFSRVGRLNATYAEIELDAALDAALSNLETSIEEAGAQIVRSAPLPPVIGDPTLMAMLWQNLIGNAVKFRHEDRAPRIVIDCEAGAGDDDGQWLITVSDNGIGIAAEFVDKVFVIFQRLHGRDTYTGTGIGLALCKKIVEHHGGAIWIDTDYTDGTRFRFTLPAALTAPHAATDELAAASSEGTPS
ncbi:CHASE3 domain-containing protein [Mycobacterium sp. CPCC 205372]|uniref:histidine kinase n=1 Tax=Mycobacterium hippophais TaxID=3016340 RepID=A0ABT4PVL2_9MYCO|nr:sensor histidine kinase [Mycobacterium hippophais]MCZ8380612.1 CHASE3 domain-containing protein [Mycobacterium hippophais]